MFSNIATYCRFPKFLGRDIAAGDCNLSNMQSAGDSKLVDETFNTPGSSTVDLLTMSPTGDYAAQAHNHTVDDLLTGEHFNTSHCDVTMQDAHAYDDMLIDPSSIDYLVKCAESNSKQSHFNRGKDSLFVKFDPLYAKQRLEAAQINSLSNLNEYDIGYETGSTASVATDGHDSPKYCASNESMMFCGKPTQIVQPAVKQEPAHNVSHARSTPALVRSVSAIMTPSRVAIDRLISISGNTPPAPVRYSSDLFNSHQMDHIQSLRMLLHEQQQQLNALRDENRELKASLHDREREFARVKEDMDDKIRKLTNEKSNLAEKEKKLMVEVNEKALNIKQLCTVMEEYEKTISSLIGEQQRDKVHSKQHEEQMRAERDDALLHLTNTEGAFNDLLAKYEKCKSLLLEFKDREKTFTEKIEEYEEGLKKYDSLYTNLKEATEKSLANANETLENNKKSHNNEIAKLQASIKKHELTISSLQETLSQKTRDNEELSRICDQLINACQE